MPTRCSRYGLFLLPCRCPFFAAPLRKGAGEGLAGCFGGSMCSWKQTLNICSTPDKCTLKAPIPIWPRPPWAAFSPACQKGPAHLREESAGAQLPIQPLRGRRLHPYRTKPWASPRGQIWETCMCLHLPLCPAATQRGSGLDQLRAEQSAPVSSRCCSDARPARSPWKPRQREAALVLLLVALQGASTRPRPCSSRSPVQSGGREEYTLPRPLHGCGASGDEQPAQPIPVQRKLWGGS